MDKTKFNNRREWRKFGIGLGVILCAVAAVQLLKGRPAAPYFLAAGAVSAGLGIAMPAALKPLFVVLLVLGEILGWISTRVLLAALFYAVLTPIALIRRLAGRGPMPMAPEPKASTYWIERGKKFDDPASFENQF
ncbi:MAG: SxtJ family membrane protein [bacterium]|nr:SxtJ family membrane protein [bacterium]